ncbi:hydroxypyruvate isomerase family protein [Mameliella sediminis]|uniref:hydroxypyruvate isomerase family protein n=1 Tax=Mameliella sediminis TaxID=2836866 RepID=UPI001C474725|nr:TIM barrel protein [Mameliella sediminis]MBV7396891.1 TIM barrel protein [Mameliella sediminis]MBY6116151.1 TIM barrel protein [Antarctobacter heliothermus]MBY6146116.1 TIM barrel protein [Mameliella alba]MCA0955301.1 TIM barrel protein [Mameliella alba]
MRFSANLGFLWADRPLPEAIRAAKASGFDAVECHWPYDIPTDAVKAALDETGLQMLGLNTRRGAVAAGDNGLSAIPGREAEARSAIDEGIAYAAAIGTPNIHVMAGFAAGYAARNTFVSNLKYACAQSAPHGITILIEPLNKYDAPGYFLTTTDQALAIIEAVGMSNLKLMFDCYHVQLMEGDLSHRIETLLPSIGHIQFASVPGRGSPDHGEINYDHVFRVISDLGYGRPLGAEYKPDGSTDDTLGWLNDRVAKRV